MSLNVVVLCGRLARTPELKYTPTGVPFARFTLAVDRNMAANSEAEQKVDWIPCIAWRNSAEFAGTFLSKGSRVAVEGRLQIRQYEAEGQKRTATEVVCNRVDALETKKEREERETQNDSDMDREDS